MYFLQLDQLPLVQILQSVYVAGSNRHRSTIRYIVIGRLRWRSHDVVNNVHGGLDRFLVSKCNISLLFANVLRLR